MMFKPFGIIDLNYNYFASGLVGNTNSDYCPISTSVTDNDILFKNRCVGGTTELPNGLNEIIGDSSACFYSSIKDANNSSHQSLSNFGICYKYSCDSATRKINVIGSQTINCPTTGGPMAVTEGTTSGFLYCPDYNLLCTKSAPCSNLVDCIMNKSLELVPNYDYIIGQVTTFPAGIFSAAASPTPSSANLILIKMLNILILALIMI